VQYVIAGVLTLLSGMVLWAFSKGSAGAKNKVLRKALESAEEVQNVARKKLDQMGTGRNDSLAKLWAERDRVQESGAYD
jgi:flagellar hook-basal body complex protein FliE